METCDATIWNLWASYPGVDGAVFVKEKIKLLGLMIYKTIDRSDTNVFRTKIFVLSFWSTKVSLRWQSKKYWVIRKSQLSFN